jgi:hypothetical protein
MMEKSALAGESGEPSRTKLQCTLQLEGRYTPCISSLPLYVLYGAKYNFAFAFFYLNSFAVS